MFTEGLNVASSFTPASITAPGSIVTLLPRGRQPYARLQLDWDGNLAMLVFQTMACVMRIVQVTRRGEELLPLRIALACTHELLCRVHTCSLLRNG